MAAHTLIPPDDLAALLGHYHLSPFTEYQMLPGASLHSHYLITSAEGRFVLNILDGLSDQRALNMAKCLHYLATQGIPCPHPLATISGNLLTHCYQRPVYLYRFLEGKPPQNLHHEAGLYAAGTLLARVHRCQVNFPVFSFQEKIVLYQNRRLALKSLLNAPLYEALKLAPSDERLPSGICHGDWNVKNLLCNEKGQLTACLDFDHCYKGPFIYDIAHALNLLIPELNHEALHEAFFAGYETIRTIEPSEQLALADYRLLAASHVLINELSAKFDPQTFYSHNLEHAQAQFDALKSSV